jgi:GT2 family glycosyltransferase
MKVSVIIPVWNGEAVIGECLKALYAHATASLLEVICVDNASMDGSAAIIASFPQARLLEQPVNLGFAGGVNVGLAAAQGDLMVLLNQDCLVHEGWLTAVTAAFSQSPQAGIVGGLIFHEDGTLDHAGAHISRPEGYGEHETAVLHPTAPYPVEYVTGALFAISRAAWQALGPLDDGFYPGYYEESDYCYRARQRGYDILCAPAIQATHLRSSRAWQQDPLRHQANQHRSRYRFIAKHFSAAEIVAFGEAEEEGLDQEGLHIHQIIGRLLALRDSLRDLPALSARRQQEPGQPANPERERLLNVTFTRLLRRTWAKLQEREIVTAVAQLHTNIQASQEKLKQIQKQESDLLAQIHFRHPGDSATEPGHKQRWRTLALRTLSLITLREHRLLARLTTLQVAHLDQLNDLYNKQRLLEKHLNHVNNNLNNQISRLSKRLDLLEKLIDYEYR